jgi:hypothetical protein
MDMMEILPGSNEGGHIAGFLPGHVAKIAHETDPGVVDVATDRRSISLLTQEVGLGAVERLEQEAGLRLIMYNNISVTVMLVNY